MEPSDTVLVVSDDEQQRHHLERLLVDQGYSLLLAGGGAEEPARLGGRPPDVILVDVSSLGPGGPEACQALRDRPALAEVPILLIAPAAAWPAGALRDWGADDWVSSPLEPTELLARLRGYSRLSRHRRQLAAAVGRHAAEATILNRIAQVITSSLDLDETLSIIADHAHWLLDTVAASVVLRDEQGELWFGAASGEGADHVRGRHLKAGQGVVSWVMQHGEPLMIHDPAADPRFFGEWDRESGFCTQSILCVPLRAKGQTIGAIEAINKASGPFDDDDLALLTSLAASAAIALDNARLYARAQQEIDERRAAEARLRRLNTTLQTMSECQEALILAREEGDLLRSICRVLVEVGGHRLAWVGYAQQDRSVRPVAWVGHEQGYLAEVAISWDDTERGQGPVGAAIRSRQPAIIPDVASDPRFAPWRDQALARGYASVCALPLIDGGLVLGALALYSAEVDAFDDQELRLLKEMANNLAFGIAALRLRARGEQAEEEVRRLYATLRDHASGLEAMVAERTRQLQAERDRTRAILEAVGEAVVVTDLKGRIQYLNPAAVDLTGYTVDEAIGWSPPPESAETEPVAPAPGARRPQRSEVVSRRRDGTLYDAAMTVAPLFDSEKSNRLVGYVAIQRDITPIKNAERMKDQFVSNVSHELRTPLSVIALVSGNLDRLYDRLSDEQRRKLIGDIRQQARVLNELISDVLDISRIEGGSISVERRRVDLAGIVAEEVEKQRPLAQTKAQVLDTLAHGPLPVWAHDEQVRQVVSNLLNNAIKYTPVQGGILCQCQEMVAGQARAEEWPGSGALPPGRWAGVRVVDNGIGISAEDLPRVYERFFRVKTEGNIAGTGLGLAIARELVEAHGGSIAAASSPGEGSIFAVYLSLMED